MTQPAHFRIDYLLKGCYKTLYVSAPDMDNALAWHWAAVDAGFGPIPKFRSDNVPKLSKHQAQSHGITDVEWAKT